MIKRTLVLYGLSLFLYGKTEGHDILVESDSDAGDGNRIKYEDQSGQQVQVPTLIEESVSKTEEVKDQQEGSTQLEYGIADVTDKNAQIVYEQIVAENNSSISKMYDYKLKKQQELKETLLEEVQKHINAKNIQGAQNEKEFGESAADINEHESVIKMIQDEELSFNSESELKKTELFLESNANRSLQNIHKRILQKINEQRILEQEFRKKLNETKSAIISSVTIAIENMQNGKNFNNMTVSEKSRAVKYFKYLVKQITDETNYEQLGWYPARSFIKNVKTIVANESFNPNKLKSMAFNAKAVSSPALDRCFNAACALDGNVGTGWVSRGKTGFLNVSFVDVEKPVRQIYFVMRRLPFGSIDPIYKANITINRDIKATTGRINNNEVLLIEFTNSILLKNINFVIVDGKNHPGIFEIILYP